MPEFTIVKAEAKAPHVAPAPNAFPKCSAIPELVGYPAETVYSAGSESPLLSRGSGTQAPHCASQCASDEPWPVYNISKPGWGPALLDRSLQPNHERSLAESPHAILHSYAVRAKSVIIVPVNVDRWP